jgi:hypothetical protein
MLATRVGRISRSSGLNLAKIASASDTWGQNWLFPARDDSILIDNYRFFWKMARTYRQKEHGLTLPPRETQLFGMQQTKDHHDAQQADCRSEQAAFKARDGGGSEFPAKQPTLIVGKNLYKECRQWIKTRKNKMLFHITQTHPPELCPKDEGGSTTLYDPKAEGVKFLAMYGAFPEHVIYYIIEAENRSGSSRL